MEITKFQKNWLKVYEFNLAAGHVMVKLFHIGYTSEFTWPISLNAGMNSFHVVY